MGGEIYTVLRLRLMRNLAMSLKLYTVAFFANSTIIMTNLKF